MLYREEKNKEWYHRMAIDSVKEYLARFGAADRVREFATSSATVELAAQTLGVLPGRIAKTLSFRQNGGCLLVVMAGDVKIDNAKFKTAFAMKAKMLTPEEAVEMTGFSVGGVCPFAVPKDVPVYLDRSLQRFETVFPACGSSNSAIELTCDELYQYADAVEWIDVCKA